MSDYEQFQGTRPVAEAHSFDMKRLESYMREHVDGFTGNLQVEQFKGGQSNPTFMLKAGEKKYVLRRKPPGKRARPMAELGWQQVEKILAETR